MKKHFHRFYLPLLCYGAALLVWLLGCGWVLCGDLLARAGGTMQQQTVPLSAFSLVNAELVDDTTLQCTDTDPQLIYTVPAGQRVRTLTFAAQYSIPHWEIALYYTTADGQNFSNEQRVMPTENADGSFSFVLPAKQLVQLRLEPCCTAARLTDFTAALNIPLPWWNYFVPDGMKAFWMLLLPGLVSAALDLFRQGYSQGITRKIRRKQ